MYKYEYKIKVKNDVKSLKLDVVLNDSSATYEVKGNENFKVGENVVEIIVKAENGDTRTYTIKVTRADKDDSKVKEENNGAAKPIIIALIIWAANLYITLIFTAVWYVQRSAWILSFFLSVFFDLVIGELLIEGICAFLYSKRVKYDCMKNLGESLNRLRSYRTMWP